MLGHPIGNGRIGGMVVGHPLRERIGLNHDRLWRQYYSFRKYDTASIMPEFRRLCAADRFSEAQGLLLSKCVKEATLKYGGIDLTSSAINPMVPVGDLGICPTHKPAAKIEAFRRSLDLDTGIAIVQYRVDQVDYTRESFVSWPAGVLVTRLTASQPGQLAGEVSLSRLLDPACFVTGKATPGHLLIEGEFDEGVRFATATRVINKRGQFSAGIETYQAPPGEMSPKYPPNTFSLHWWGEPRSDEISGVTNRYTGADEIILLVSIATENESAQPAQWCRQKLADTLIDYQNLRAEHVKDHRQFYRRVHLRLGEPGNVILTEKWSNRQSSAVRHHHCYWKNCSTWGVTWQSPGGTSTR